MSKADAVVEGVGGGFQERQVDGAPGWGSVVHARHRDRDYALRRVLLMADMAGLYLALVVAMVVAGRGEALLDAVWLLLIAPLWALLFLAYGLYQRPLRRIEPTHLDDLSSLFHALVVGTLGLWLFYKVVPVERLNLSEVVVFAAVALPLLAALRVAVRLVNLYIQGPERVFVVAPVEEVVTLRRKLGNHPEYEMKLVGATVSDEVAEELGLYWSAPMERLDELIASGEIDHLVVQMNPELIRQSQIVELKRACYRAGVRFGVFPMVRNLLMPGVDINHIEGWGFLSYHPPVLSHSSRMLKRGMDLLLSSLLLVGFAPLMALIALAVKLDSKGPALYRQTRIGKEGRPFQLLKFRTMVPGADTRTEELMALSTDPDWLILERDPRVTRVGRFLRRTSLDELPQLWNVLRGDMSMVGPRPLSEGDDEAVSGWGRHRLDITPGITGYWQVLGRNSIPFREMVEIDYAYVASWSLWQDIKLLLRTVPAVLMRRGAQ